MKNMRIPLLIALGVAVLGIILGSFLDLNISSAVASASNNFALLVSAIGPTIGFASVAAMGGGFIAFIVKGKYHIVLKILFGVLATCCLGVALYFPGREYFGVNGFYNPDIKWLGYVIVLIPEVGAMVGGYFLFRNYKNDKLWIVFCIIIGLLLIALVAVLPTIKNVMRRPRFRFLASIDNMSLFHNWWEPCKNYKDLMETYHIESSDHFKSFPSGHTAEACIPLVIITFLGLAGEDFKKYQMPAFYFGCILVVVVAAARILAAAHFLSDVSWGATITLTLIIIANEVVMRVKALQLKKE